MCGSLSDDGVEAAKMLPIWAFLNTQSNTNTQAQGGNLYRCFGTSLVVGVQFTLIRMVPRAAEVLPVVGVAVGKHLLSMQHVITAQISTVPLGVVWNLK